MSVVRRQKLKLVLVALLSLAIVQPVFAQSSSNNYRVEEAYFGTGGEVDISSPNFQGQAGLGSLGVGFTSSANFDAETGFLTPDEIFLEFVVTDATVDLGVLQTDSPSHGAAQGGACNCSFYVRSYVSSGYVVVSASQPPTSEGGAVLDAKSTTGAPSTDPGVEEFGINLRANTSPATFGAEPFNDPDGTFADGAIAAGYGTQNQFKYGVDDVIASSPGTVGNQGVGKTDYTVSYIAKRSNITPAGFYSMDHVLIATPTY